MVKRRRKVKARRRMSVGLMTATSVAAGVGNMMIGGTYNVPYEIGAAIKGEQSWGDAASKTVQAVTEGAPGLVAAVVPVVVGRVAMRMFGIPNPRVLSTKRFDLNLV